MHSIYFRINKYISTKEIDWYPNKNRHQSLISSTCFPVKWRGINYSSTCKRASTALGGHFFWLLQTKQFEQTNSKRRAQQRDLSHRQRFHAKSIAPRFVTMGLLTPPPPWTRNFWRMDCIKFACLGFMRIWELIAVLDLLRLVCYKLDWLLWQIFCRA